MILRFINLISLIFLISTQHHSTYEFEKTLHLMLVVLIVSNVERTALRFVEREHVHWNRALRHVKAHVTRLISPRNIRRNIRTTRYFFFSFFRRLPPRSIIHRRRIIRLKKSSNVDRLTRFAKREGMKRGKVFNVRFECGVIFWSKFRGSVADAWFCRTSFASGIFVNYRGCISFWS